MRGQQRPSGIPCRGPGSGSLWGILMERVAWVKADRLKMFAEIVGPSDSNQRTNLSGFVLYGDSQEQEVRILAKVKSQGHMGFESDGLKFELLA